MGTSFLFSFSLCSIQLPKQTKYLTQGLSVLQIKSVRCTCATVKWFLILLIFKALSIVHLQTVVSVSQECYSDHQCNGINYHSLTRTCELIHYTTSKRLLMGEEYADGWQLWLPGICMSVLFQRALHICIDFFKEKKRIITRMISWAWKYTFIAIVILLLKTLLELINTLTMRMMMSLFNESLHKTHKIL